MGGKLESKERKYSANEVIYFVNAVFVGVARGTQRNSGATMSSCSAARRKDIEIVMKLST